MPYQDDLHKKQNIYAFIGMTLSLIQTTESLIHQTLLFVFQEGDSLDLEAWKKQEKFLERKTLGQLIFVLRKRVGIDDSLEGLLTNFITNRNVLAHNLSSIKGYDMDSEEGRKAIHNFLAQLFDTTTRIMRIFTAINLSWSEQTGIKTQYDHDVRNFIGEEFFNFSELLFYEK